MESLTALCAPCLLLFIFAIPLSGIVNLILFIILMVNFYKGKTTGDFLDYYNGCLSEINKKYLEGVFEKLDTLDSQMTAFVTLNFISIFLGCISAFVSQLKDGN